MRVYNFLFLKFLRYAGNPLNISVEINFAFLFVNSEIQPNKIIVHLSAF